MRINLYSFQSLGDLNKDYPFYYIGTDFLKYRSLSKKYKELKFDYDLTAISNKEKNFFLNWIEENRKLNKDSIYWWQTSLGSKNNLFSKFYDIICQFRKFERCIKKNKNFFFINLICEDEFIKLFVFQNLNKKNISNLNKIDNKKIIKKDPLIEIKFFFKKIFLLSKLFLFSRITKFMRNKNLPKGEVLLFHNCLNKNFIVKNKTIICNYFGILPLLLKNKNKQIYSLPWIPIEMLNLSFFKKVSNIKRIFIPDDYLEISDYFKLLFNSSKQIKDLNIKKKYKNLDLSKLVEREKIKENHEMHFIFLRYLPAIEKWSKKINKLVIYDHYENLQFEHPLRYFCKKKKNFHSVGYYHSYVSKNFLSYQHNFSEWKSNFKPDKIVTHSKFAKKLLVQQGVPKKLIFVGNDFRENKINLNKKSLENNILVPLSLNENSNYEIIKSLHSINNPFLLKNRISVIIRTHPMYDKNKQIKKLEKITKFPKNWFISQNKEINSDILKSKCAITLSSASSFNCIRHGLPVLNLKSNLTVLSNYMDFLPRNNFLSKTYKADEIIKILRTIFVSKKIYKQKDLVSMKNLLNLNNFGYSYKKIKSFLI